GARHPSRQDAADPGAAAVSAALDQQRMAEDAGHGLQDHGPRHPLRGCRCAAGPALADPLHVLLGGCATVGGHGLPGRHRIERKKTTAPEPASAPARQAAQAAQGADRAPRKPLTGVSFEAKTEEALSVATSRAPRSWRTERWSDQPAATLKRF